MLRDKKCDVGCHAFPNKEVTNENGRGGVYKGRGRCWICVKVVYEMADEQSLLDKPIEVKGLPDLSKC